MASTAVAFPIIPGKLEESRRFAEEVRGPRRQEMDQALRQWGVTREDWYLQTAPQGDMIIVYIEADDPLRVFHRWAQSNAPFDCWFKQQAGEICGLDFDQPLPGLPEPTFAWQAR